MIRQDAVVRIKSAEAWDPAPEIVQKQKAEPDSSEPEAAMVEPLAVAVHAVSISEISENSTALVVGAGMIGLLVLQALRAKDCSRN